MVAARRVVEAVLRAGRVSADVDYVTNELNRIADHLEEHARGAGDAAVTQVD